MTPKLNTKKIITSLFIAFLFAIFFSALETSKIDAAVSTNFNYQGKLSNASDVPVSDGVYDMVVKIYNVAGSTAPALWTENWNSATLWTETGSTTVSSGDGGDCPTSTKKIIYTTGTNEGSLKAGQLIWNTTIKQSSVIYSVTAASNYICVYNPTSTWSNGDDLTNQIYVKNGIFNISIGTVTDMTLDFSGSAYYLGVAVGADSEMTPRKPMSAVPQAINSGNLITSNGRIDVGYTGASNSGMNISYNPASGSTDAGVITYGSGGGTGTALKVVQSGTGKILGLYDDSLEIFTVLNGGNVGIGNTNPTGVFQVGIGATTPFFISTGGSVGIGTTNPLYTLEVNGSMNATTLYQNGVQVSSVGAGSVTGQTLYWNGSAWTANSNLFNNNTNVGIGTTNPTNGPLDIVRNADTGVGAWITNSNAGSSAYALWGAYNGTAYGEFGVGSSATTAGVYASRTFLTSYGGNGLSLIASEASGDMRFFTGGEGLANERMRILSGGNVGIGITNPATMLHIFGSNNGLRLGYDVSNYATLSSASNGDFTVITSSATDSALTLGNNSATNLGLLFDSNATDYYIGRNSANNNLDIGVGLTVGSGTKISINSSGYLGIGTTNPGALLQVHAPNSTNAIFSAGTANVFLNVNNADSGGNNYMYMSLGSAVTEDLQLISPSSGSTKGFAVRNNGGSWNRLSFFHTDVYGGIQTSGSTPLALQADGGNVGIGTTNPGSKLSVTGDITTSGLFNIGPVLRFTHTNTAAYNATDATKDTACTGEYGSNYQAASASDVAVYAHGATVTATYFVVAGNTSNRMYLSYAGEPQVISSSTGTQLVACIRKDAPLRFSRSTAAYNATDATKDTACTTDLGSNYQSANALEVGAYAAGGAAAGVDDFVIAGNTSNKFYLLIGSDAAPGLYASSTGTRKVACIRTGIQTGADIAEFIPTMETNLSPGDILSIDPKNNVMAQKSKTSYDSKILGVVPTQPGAILGSEAKDSENTLMALAGRVPVKVSNKSGPIANGDPITSSDISGVGMKATKAGQIVGKAMETFDPAKNKDKIISCPKGSPKGLICGKIMTFVNISWQDPATQLAQSKSQNNYFGSLSIDKDGNTGIGTLNPTSKLQVNGDIKIVGGSLIADGKNLKVPDYVFENGYQLRTMEDLESYVDQYKHLPGVASRSEIKQNGMNYGNMMMSLLEKTEENTQYILQNYHTVKNLEKTAQLLGEQIASQSQKNDSNFESIVQKMAKSSDRVDYLGSNVNYLKNRIDNIFQKLASSDKAVQSASENKSFYQFSEVTGEVRTNLANAKIENSYIEGQYENRDQFQEITVKKDEGLDLSEYDTNSAALSFKIYIENADSISDIYTEIGNEMDAKEIQWGKTAHPWFVSGWNEVRLNITEGVKTGEIDFGNLNYMRVYFKFKSANLVRIKDISLSVRKTVLAENTPETVENSAVAESIASQNSQLSALQKRTTDLEDQMKLIQDQNKAVIDFALALNTNSLIYKDAEGSLDLLNGKLKAQKVVAGAYSVKVADENSATIGEGKIIPIATDANWDGIDDATGGNGKSITISTTAVKTTSKVFVSAKGQSAVRVPLTVTEKIEGQHFRVEIPDVTSEEVAFDWWIVEKE